MGKWEIGSGKQEFQLALSSFCPALSRVRVILGLLHNKKLLDLSWEVTKALYCLRHEGISTRTWQEFLVFSFHFERRSCRCNPKLTFLAG